MIGFFPRPYTNEIYFSLIARYDLLSMNVGRQTVKELFGVSKDLDVEYPLGLSELIKKIEIFSPKYTVNYFLENHTTYPFYKVFHQNIFHEEIATNDFNLRVTYPRKKKKKALEIRFCPKCLKEHNDKYGDVYLNRIHQIPGVLVCSKHKIMLNVMRNFAEANLSPKYSLPLRANLNEENTSVSEKLMKDLLLYESDIQFIFDNALPNLSLNEISRKYIELLKVKGLGYPIKKRIGNSRELVEEVYSREFLRYFYLDKNGHENWIFNMLNNVSNEYVNHIVFMRALAGSVKSFFEEHIEYKPIGYGPWICMNPFCQDYKNKIIEDVEIGIHKLTGLIHGDIKCHCGFIYRLREGESDPLKVPYFTNRVMERGAIWENTVYELRARNYYIEEIAKMAGVSRPTIRKFLNNNYNSRWDGLGVERERKTKKYKDTWLEIRKNNPTLNRNQLNSLNRAAYAWLRKYEPNWIEANSPESIKGKSSRRINIDTENIIKQIKDLYFSWEDFESSTGKLRRRTLNLLKTQVKIPTNYKKYPKICNAIDEYQESITDFRKRKIKNYLRVECAGKVVRYSVIAEKLRLRTPIRLGDEEIKKFLLGEIKKHNNILQKDPWI